MESTLRKPTTPSQNAELVSVEHQPTLRHVLHPRADVGGEVAGPEEAEIRITQSANRLRQLRRFRFWKSLYDGRGLVGRGGQVLFIQFGSAGQRGVSDSSVASGCYLLADMGHPITLFSVLSLYSSAKGSIQ